MTRSLLPALFFALVLPLGCGVQPPGPPHAPGSPECKLGSNGQQTCGYNCQLGSGGSWFCASTPAGKCALNANGTWTCP